MNDSEISTILQETQAWLYHAVIGLNLCPFAKSVYVKKQIDYQISTATDEISLLHDLEVALTKLATTPADKIDTSLVIHPYVLKNFFDFNDFLYLADDLLRRLELDGILQIASFHPDYQFADTTHDDVSNCTNRSPYPMLHLLREASLDQAVTTKSDWESIVDHNIQTMTTLGWSGWEDLQKRIRS